LEKVLLITVICAGFVFALLNGFHDGCNIIAAVLSSRTAGTGTVLFLVCAAEFVGALILGTAVAATVGKQIVNPQWLDSTQGLMKVLIVLSALLSAILLHLLTSWAGSPASTFHGLVGGLVGAGMAAFGAGIVNWQGLFFGVILVLLLSPLVAAGAGFLSMSISGYLLRGDRIRLNGCPRWVQLISMLFLGASHGANDAQKCMGVIGLALVFSGSLGAFEVPHWLIPASAGTLVLGTFAGGLLVVRTLGDKVFRVNPVQSLNAQVCAASVIFGANLLGGPVSATQVIGASIEGVGAAGPNSTMQRMIRKEMVVAWLVVLPGSAALSSTLFWIASGSLGQGMGTFHQLMRLFIG